MVQISTLSSGVRKPGLKALLVAFLVTLMFGPVTLVTRLIEERKQRADTVTGEVGRIWGGRDQAVAGPFLVVPYEAENPESGSDRRKAGRGRHYAVILPDELAIDAEIRTQSRFRGIFEVPVYQAHISVSGRFDGSALAAIAGDGARVLAEEAFLVVNISDPRGLRSGMALSWAGKEHAFLPGAGFNIFDKGGIHAMLKPSASGAAPSAGDPGGQTDNSDPVLRASGERAQPALPGVGAGTPVAFAFDMILNGSRTLKFLPVGRSTDISVNADWPSPSFSGGFLPTTHDVTSGGFTARWQVPDLARNFPQSWRAGETPDMAPALVGIDLYKGVDFYQKVARSTKYAILFFGFTFLAFFLTEVVSSARIHPVQYLMTGAAQIVFYLLLLSIAEHAGFDTAYTVAASATILLVTVYGGSAVGSAAFALVLFAVLVAIYALLYSLLQAGDFALLFGSVAAFLGLAVTMLLTRRVDWYGLTGSESA